MGFDSISLEDQLDNLWKKENDVLTLETKNKKYVVISDMHMGDGGTSDDFRRNEAAVMRALRYYKNKGFILILLGDVEELWQFSADEIVKRYDESIYKSIREFGDDKVYRVFGNHDIDWKITDPIRKKSTNSNKVYEGIKLKDGNGKSKILLVHGHQGTKDSDKYSSISRTFVRSYRHIEPLLKIDKTPSVPRSPIQKTFERDRYNWAKKNKLMIVCGHSHRAVFCSKSKIDRINENIEKLKNELKRDASIPAIGIGYEKLSKLKDQVIDERLLDRSISVGVSNPAPNYFNTGCALYKDGITVIEIDNDIIKLIKWHRNLLNKEEFSSYEQANLSECIKNL